MTYMEKLFVWASNGTRHDERSVRFSKDESSRGPEKAWCCRLDGSWSEYGCGSTPEGAAKEAFEKAGAELRARADEFAV